MRTSRRGSAGGYAGIVPALTALVFLGFSAPSAGGSKDLDLSAPTGARLLHYRLSCRAPRGCRIDCFQAGVKVVATRSIAPSDATRLVVSDGIADDFTPRWLELRRGAGTGAEIETILLPANVLCDLQGLTIEPLDGGG